MNWIKACAFGAVISVVGGGSAWACDVVTAYQMRLSDAVYEMSLNGVYVEHSEEPSGASGGGPFRQWLVPGENNLTFDLKSGAADIEVIEACATSFDGETLVQASLSGAETRDLTFFVETPPPAIYFDLAPLKRKGLPKAVQRLQAAVEERNFKRFWRLYQGLRMTAEANGFPMEEMKPQVRQMVKQGEISLESDLVFTPVLGGRVWQVMTKDRKAPATLTMRQDDWTNVFATGVFWTKVDGKWRVVGT
ncbi:MAG: hypothetical protein AAFU55_03595 [Pseudomonadota bacterium]